MCHLYGVLKLVHGFKFPCEEPNRYGMLYLQQHPNLKTRIVDGTSLAVAVVLNSFPQGTAQVLLRGNLTKTGYAVALALLQMNVQVYWLTMYTNSLLLFEMEELSLNIRFLGSSPLNGSHMTQLLTRLWGWFLLFLQRFTRTGGNSRKEGFWEADITLAGEARESLGPFHQLLPLRFEFSLISVSLNLNELGYPKYISKISVSEECSG